MIELKNIKKSFDGRILFDNISMKIDNGEFLVLNGESGCGKTTLLNIIGGIESIDSGEVLIEGRDISKRKNQIWLFGEKIGFLFQNFALIESKSVVKNLEMVKSKFRCEVSIDDALKNVGLEDKRESMVYTLSGGEQQRIALARLMIKKCDIILADEPTDRKSVV